MYCKLLPRIWLQAWPQVSGSRSGVPVSRSIKCQQSPGAIFMVRKAGTGLDGPVLWFRKVVCGRRQEEKHIVGSELVKGSARLPPPEAITYQVRKAAEEDLGQVLAWGSPIVLRIKRPVVCDSFFSASRLFSTACKAEAGR